MSKQTERIARKLKYIGAAYHANTSKHIAPNDPGVMSGDAVPTYHILPNIDRPYESSVLRFYSLRTLEGWLDTVIAAEKLPDGEDSELMSLWYEANY